MSTLKKYAYGLLVTTFGLINFGYCDDLGINMWKTKGEGRTVERDYTQFQKICVLQRNTDGYDGNGEFSINGGSYQSACYWDGNQFSLLSCCVDGGILKLKSNYNFTDFWVIGYNKLTSQQCQLDYSLIPISSIDTNYCVGNGFCPTNECTGGTSSGTNWSALYINNIQKPGTPLINITIPEEIQRDEYYDSGESNIDIIGYGYDQDKMQQMVNTQYYKPTAEEMSGLIEKIADFLPFIAVALLITRIRRVIKKVFKF